MPKITMKKTVKLGPIPRRIKNVLRLGSWPSPRLNLVELSPPTSPYQVDLHERALRLLEEVRGAQRRLTKEEDGPTLMELRRVLGQYVGEGGEVFLHEPPG